MTKFRVLRGKHHEHGRAYVPGDVVDSAFDLNKMNTPAGAKFEELRDQSIPATGEEPEPEPAETEVPEFEGWDIKQLREYAEEHEIDVSDLKRRDAIIKKIQEAEVTPA